MFFNNMNFNVQIKIHVSFFEIKGIKEIPKYLRYLIHFQIFKFWKRELIQKIFYNLIDEYEKFKLSFYLFITFSIH